jgi:hypothetical protein
MKSVRTQHRWDRFVKFYSEQYKGRKTRLGVFDENNGVTNDLWVEHGLPVLGIGLDPSGELPTNEVLLDGYSHSVADARGLNAHFSLDGDEDGLDIVHGNGTSTVLRFERD